MKKISVVLSVTALVLGLICLGCGKDRPLSSAEEQSPPARLAKAAGMSAMGNRAVVAATVTQEGAPVAGAEVSFSRSVSGQAPDYRWKGTTDAEGKAEIEIVATDPQFWRVGASGYYLAKAVNPTSGAVLGQWGSIPINGGQMIALSLPVGGHAQVNSQSPRPASEQELLAVDLARRKTVNTHNIDDILSYFTDDGVLDFVPAPSPMGMEQIGPFFEDLFRGFPDWRQEPGNVLVSDNIVVGEIRAFETLLGEWQGIPPTGKAAVVPFLDICDFEGDRLKRSVTYSDMVTTLIQLGAMPAPDPVELVPSFTLPDPEPTGLSPLEANDELLARWNAHDAARWAQIIHSDADIFYAAIGTPMSRDAAVALQEVFFRGFSDVRGEIVRMVDMGDGWVLVEAVFGGTQDGPYLGIPATGRYADVSVVWMARSDADGMMTYFHCYFDNSALLRDMGVVQ